MKKLLVLAVICCMVTGAFAQKAIFTRVVKLPTATHEQCAEDAIKFQSGTLGEPDSVIISQSMATLIYKRVRIEMEEDDYRGYAEVSTKKRAFDQRLLVIPSKQIPSPDDMTLITLLMMNTVNNKSIKDRH